VIVRINDSRHVRAALCLLVLTLAGATVATLARQASALRIPSVFANITHGADGQLTFRAENGTPHVLRERPPAWTLRQFRGSPRGTDKGLALDFQKPGFTGTLIFGLVPYDDTRYPQPVYRTSVPIKDGKTEIDITARLAGTYDMVGWQKTGRGVVGYRVITPEGGMLYDGRVRFKGTGPFEVDVTMVEGPFVANVTPTSAIIWFELDRPAPCSVRVGRQTVACQEHATRQELRIARLAPATGYTYAVRYGETEERYGFRTAPAAGTRHPFTFGYASDSRGGQGGGDRDLNGPNAYIMRRIMALALVRNLSFLQFTGDLVSGYVGSPEALLVELANWKRAVEPWAHWIPLYTGIGNHEAILRDFVNQKGGQVRVPRFPFETESTEATFARALVNPENGPASEDGAVYDPDPNAVDFPTYRENVYWHAYDNAAMVVLNTDYWFAPTLLAAPQAGGNLHAYLMDNQVAWLATVLDALERNAAIDHVFLTAHTPVFPNGGHVGDDMWYGGKNEPRPWVAGKPVAKGIIERRDDLLRLIQRHPKVLAILTGDEHNYNRLRLAPGVEIYPQTWDKPKVALRRPFYQINNGAAGAPYYAQDLTPPWSAHAKAFSTQHALCLFHVEGPRVRLEVVNPDTLEVIDRVVLR
jgi:hypothetical protein